MLLLLLFFSDALSSVVALGGVCGTIIGLPLLDPLAGCEENAFFEACSILKAIILPRQARDKHIGKTLRKRDPCVLCRLVVGGLVVRTGEYEAFLNSIQLVLLCLSRACLGKSSALHRPKPLKNETLFSCFRR
eukprot:COSAG06_NODE_4682_length_4037_cov_11.317166_4_plen_133_part_00